MPSTAHARTQSAFPSLIDTTSRVHLSPARVQNQRHNPSESPDIMPSFENEPDAHSDYGVRLVDLARNSYEHLPLEQHHALVAAPPKAASPLRPALTFRLLSSITNAQPAAAALTRKGSVLHSRAKSLAAFVPKLSTTDASTSEKAPSTPTRLFADYFHGESAPIRLGPPVSPTKEKEETEFIMDYRSVFTDRPALLRKRATAPQPAPKASTPTTSPRSTSWFTRKPTTPSVNLKQPADELATLNINSALFPNGAIDPLDPTAFNNLLLNATHLLQRMQAAYREKVDYIATMQPEAEAQRDEVEEAETRATHLKKQLEDMSRRAQEQETTMREMARELAEERMRSLEFREAAQSSIRLVHADGHQPQHAGGGRRRKRGSFSNASDSGFESDLESIFSSNSSGLTPGTPLSPTFSSCNMSRMASCDSRLTTKSTSSNNEAVPPLPNARDTLPSQQRQQQQAKTAGNNGVPQRLGREGAAWATVDALRSENKELKRHLHEMQDELQGCIEFVSGVNAV